MNNNKLIAKNSFYLFLRTLFVMFVSLYTSRLVLELLGVDDYGVFNVVAGTVSLLIFLNSAMIQASQRYITFAQGRNDRNHQVAVYSTSLLIHILIAIVVVLLLETIGLWYVNNVLVVPETRLLAANVLFQFSIIVFLFKILVVPFQAHVVAHERMNIYAYISVAEIIVQLILILGLEYISGDKLILYGAVVLVAAVLNFSAYVIYCKKNFQECSFAKPTNLNLFIEMFKFGGWAFLGGLGFVASGHGVNLVVNYFFGPSVNAARAVAYQASAGIQSFVSGFQQSINPQITKRYAAEDSSSMMRLVQFGSKCTFSILLMICAPVMVKPEYVLGIWLGDVPNFAAQFLVLSLFVELVSSLGDSMNTAMQATGKIKVFQITVALIMCCDVPLALFLLGHGTPPYWVVLITIITRVMCVLAKAFLLHRQVAFDICRFVSSGILLNLLLAILFVGGLNFLEPHLTDGFVGFTSILLLSVVLIPSAEYVVVLNKDEKQFVVYIIQSLIGKYF